MIYVHGSSSSTKESAVRGLRNLAHNNDDIQLQIEQAGIFEPLVRNLSDRLLSIMSPKDGRGHSGRTESMKSGVPVVLRRTLNR